MATFSEILVAPPVLFNVRRPDKTLTGCPRCAKIAGGKSPSVGSGSSHLVRSEWGRMDSEAKTKTCKLCCREIDERARKCPYCRTFQDWAHTTLVDPRVQAAVFGALLLCLLVVMISLIHIFRDIAHREEDFADYRDQIQVLGSDMELGRDEDGATLCVVGTVRNNSDVAWNDIQIEVRFFDAEGKLIDATLGKRALGTVLPGAEQVFKIELRPALPPERYASWKVSVGYARDASRSF